MTTPKPPFVRHLLRLIPENLREELEGDLLQRYARDVGRMGRRRASLRYTWSTVLCLRPGILFRRNPTKKTYSPVMFRNYFIIAVRNLLAHKSNTAINALSLLIGISAALIMMAVIRYELSFDQHHSEAARTYRVNRLVRGDGEWHLEAGLPGPAASMMREKITAVSGTTAVQYYGGVQIDIEMNGEARRFKESRGAAFVDEHFLQVFDFATTDFRWLAGNPSTALSESFSVVLTETMAKKLFGETSPVGQTVRLEGQVDCRVTGLITDLPPNSDFPFTVLVSYATLYDIEGDRMRDDWQSINHDNQVFVVLPPGTTASDVETQFDKVHASLVNNEIAAAEKFRLQPLSQLHRDALLGNFNHRTVDNAALLIMTLTAVLMLLVGCINYINISTAQSTLRAKEIGVRKVLGGKRVQLISQFLTETLLIVSITCVFSIFIADFALANLTAITNMPLLTHLFAEKFTWLVIGGLILVITVVAGMYPASVIASSGIIRALKGSVAGGTTGATLRRTLVVLQFAITQVFLIGSFIVINQLRYSRNMDLGFDKELIVTAAVETENVPAQESLRQRLGTNPIVSAVSFSSSFPSGYSRNHWFVDVRRKELGQSESLGTEYQAIDTAYLHLYDIELAAGRNFYTSDSGRYALVNETLSRALGFSSPEEAVGKEISEGNQTYTVAGVVKDFHNNSSKERIGNMLFVARPDFHMAASVKLNHGTDLPAAVAELERVWKEVYPSILFDYKFFDENIERLYANEKKLSTLLQIFSIVFLSVSCLGLYGLLSFVVNRRMKELAVRKVFGASVSQIVAMVSRDYALLVGLSFLIAAPISYHLMSDWLEQYAYRVPIFWWTLALPGVGSAVLVLATLSGQLLKAASRNPADVLRGE